MTHKQLAVFSNLEILLETERTESRDSSLCSLHKFSQVFGLKSYFCLFVIALPKVVCSFSYPGSHHSRETSFNWVRGCCMLTKQFVNNDVSKEN